MATVDVEQLQSRVEALEAQLAALLLAFKSPLPKDWRSTLGMFSNDPMMSEILDEATKIREEDRHAAKTDPHYFDGQVE